MSRIVRLKLISFAERGMTLIELMVGLVVSFIVIAGALMFVIAQVRNNASSFGRTDLQREGRVAIAKIAQQIELAGLGLPTNVPTGQSTFPSYSLAFQEYRSPPGKYCTVTPDLVVASLDLKQEWHVAANGTTGGVDAGTITLQAALPDPSAASGFAQVAPDIALPAGTWVFLYQSPIFDGATLGARQGGLHGFGMVQVQARAKGATTLTMTPYSTPGTGSAFQASYPGPVTEAKLNLSQSTLGATTPRSTAVLRANVVRIGVDCGHTPQPFLYLEDANGRTLLATNVVTAALAGDSKELMALTGDVVGLRFRFLVDRPPLNSTDTGGDGHPDDLNGDGAIDLNDYTNGIDTSGADRTKFNPPLDFAYVMAVEVVVRLQSDQINSLTKQYQQMDFVERVSTPNIHTQNGAKYLFIDNTGL